MCIAIISIALFKTYFVNTFVWSNGFCQITNCGFDRIVFSGFWSNRMGGGNFSIVSPFVAFDPCTPADSSVIVAPKGELIKTETSVARWFPIISSKIYHINSKWFQTEESCQFIAPSSSHLIWKNGLISYCTSCNALSHQDISSLDCSSPPSHSGNFDNDALP